MTKAPKGQALMPFEGETVIGQFKHQDWKYPSVTVTVEPDWLQPPLVQAAEI